MLHGYQHVKKCVQLAEQAGHDNVIIGGDFCQPTVEDWAALLHRAVAELECKSYAYDGTDHGCVVAYPQKLMVASNAFDVHQTNFPKLERGRHVAYYIRIAWELKQPEPLP